MLPSHGDLTFFLQVCETLNFSRASERLGITQPALSQAMKRLEHSFGQTLFIRSKTGVKLTRPGLKMPHHARLMLNDWENVKQDAAKDEAEVRGRYVMGMHSSVGLCTLPHFLPDLLQEYPQVEIKLNHDLSRKITEDVVSFKVDFGLVVNPTSHPDLVIKELYKDEVKLFHNDDDKDRDILYCDPDLNQTQQLLGLLEKKNLVFKRVITSRNLEIIAQLVAVGPGMGILPSRVAKSLRNLKALPESPKFVDRICLVYRADTQTSLASRKISQFIMSKLNENVPQASKTSSITL